MYENGFYPTPPEVARIMLSGLSLKGYILDPSAGKGDLLDFISEQSLTVSRANYSYERGKDNLFAIEIDSGRRAILADKGYTVIDSDFLTYNGFQYFDFIIMNPPFDDGASHLLKAFDVANGATIRCLLNSQTLKNSYTEERKRLRQIIEQYGWSKDLGQAFLGAERPTDAFVTLVHLHDTRKKEAFRVNFEPEKMNGRYKLDDIPDAALTSPNVFASYEARYNAGIEAFKKLLQARQEVDFYFGPIFSEYRSPNELMGKALQNGPLPMSAYTRFLKEATKTAWSNLFAKTKLSSVITEGVQRELEKLQSQQGVMAFTKENMEELFSSLFLSRDKIMTDCIVEAFQEMTRHYKGNREYIEGWATNNAYFIGRKVILPGMISHYSSFSENGLDYSAKRGIADIEKGLCFLAGKSFDNILSLTNIYEHHSHFGELKDSEFFTARLYKKGTIHLTFKDEDLRQKFNSVVAQELFGGLPEKIKKGAYA